MANSEEDNYELKGLKAYVHKAIKIRDTGDTILWTVPKAVLRNLGVDLSKIKLRLEPRYFIATVVLNPETHQRELVLSITKQKNKEEKTT